MAIPSDFSYTRYLAAKQSVDDRALNRQVFEVMAKALRSRQESSPVAILEVGCGIGTMLERLWDWGVLQTRTILRLIFCREISLR